MKGLVALLQVVPLPGPVQSSSLALPPRLAGLRGEALSAGNGFFSSPIIKLELGKVGHVRGAEEQHPDGEGFPLNYERCVGL